MRAYQPGAVTSTEVTGQSRQSKLHLATQRERRSRMAGRGTCCGAAQAEPGALGGAAPARAGAGGEDALVGSQAWKQLHTMAALAEGQSRHSGGASEDSGRRGGTGEGPAPTDIEEPAGGVSRLRCGRSSDSDGRDLRFTGLVQPARPPHHSTAPEEQGERCRTSAVGSG